MKQTRWTSRNVLRASGFRFIESPDGWRLQASRWDAPDDWKPVEAVNGGALRFASFDGALRWLRRHHGDVSPAACAVEFSEQADLFGGA